MNDKTSGKRIVSKAEYVKAHGQMGLISLVGVIMVAIAIALGLLTIALLMTGICLIPVLLGVACVLLCTAVLAGIGTFLVGKVAHRILQSALQIDPGVPFTRSNVANLPAEDSLVRAAQEPLEQQQTILLRPASQNDITPSEQLVRPTSANNDRHVETTPR